jgi:hypothetical protein
MYILSPFARNKSPFESNALANLSNEVNLWDVVHGSTKSM